MLNMMIAIMGNTFDNSMEQWQVNTHRSRLQFLRDHAPLMTTRSAEEQTDVYMIVIKPVIDEDDNDSWQGSINAITNITKKQIMQQEQNVTRKTDKLEVAMQKQFKASRFEINHIKINQSKLESDIGALKAQNEEIMGMLQKILDKQ